MSLDTSFHIIYGYRIKGKKLEDDIQKYTSEDKDWILPNGVEYDDLFDNLANDDELTIIQDYMCGNYSYIGLPIVYKSDEYGEDWYYAIEPNDISIICSDELLDNGIKKKLPFIVGNEYDEAGLLYGELPKLYIVKRVW